MKKIFYFFEFELFCVYFVATLVILSLIFSSGCTTMTIHKEQYDSTGKVVIAKMDITAKKPPFVNQVITWSDLLGTYNADTSTQLSGFMTNILNAAAAYGAVAAKTQGVPATAPVIPDSQTVATPAPLVSTPQATITQSDQSLK